jgi:hypothetical protein
MLYYEQLKNDQFRMRSDAVETLDALARRGSRPDLPANEAVEHYPELNEYHIKLITCARRKGTLCRTRR